MHSNTSEYYKRATRDQRNISFSFLLPVNQKSPQPHQSDQVADLVTGREKGFLPRDATMA